MSDSTQLHPSEPTDDALGEPSSSAASAGENEAIARLLRLAGPRPGAPRDAAGRVRSATRKAWREGIWDARARRFLWGGIGLAAAGLITALVLPLLRSPAPDTSPLAAEVGTLGSATGEVTRLPAGETTPRALRAGETLFAGDRVETGPQTRVALNLRGGASLRLDHDTRLRLLEPRAVLLERGAVYFDSADGSAAAEPIAVHTDFGIVRHIGTQFEARRALAAADGAPAAEAQLRVRVRQGLVQLESLDATHEAGAGIELRVDGSGTLSRHETPIFGPSWDWILDVAPSFSLEGHTLEAFLDWVSRETGWQTRFVEASVGDAASHVILHGSIAGLRPDRALDAVLPTCGLEHRFEGGILLIEAEGR